MARPLAVNAAELLRRPGSERVLDVELTTVELGLVDTRFAADDVVRVRVKLESLTDGLAVVGQIDVPWLGSCRRCLRPLAQVTVSDVDELYQTTVTNPDAFEIVGDQLDLLPMVRELALLDAPTAPLCQLDCAGLCPECGVDRNLTACDCAPLPQSSPWDVLDQLKQHAEHPISRPGEAN